MGDKVVTRVYLKRNCLAWIKMSPWNVQVISVYIAYIPRELSWWDTQDISVTLDVNPKEMSWFDEVALMTVHDDVSHERVFEWMKWHNRPFQTSLLRWMCHNTKDSGYQAEGSWTSCMPNWMYTQEELSGFDAETMSWLNVVTISEHGR